jgi:hypothetical protein
MDLLLEEGIDKMIPSEQIIRKQTIRKMIDTMLYEDRFLPYWEDEMMNSLNVQFTLEGDLSDEQCEVLERLYDSLLLSRMSRL